MPAVRGVLLDIDGTLLDGSQKTAAALPGAVDIVRRLSSATPVRFVTNATSRGRDDLGESLRLAGFAAPNEHIYTPVAVAREVLTGRDDQWGVLISDPGSRHDLDWFVRADPEQARSVLVASEAHDLQVRDLFPAVEALLRGARLYALQSNRVFARHGRLVPDVGPLTAYLGYAADTTWETLGKPSPLLYEAIAREIGVPVASLTMIGDDAEFDVSGSLRAGVGHSVLVQTGKYRAGDETKFTPRPTQVIASVADLDLGIL